jgi:lipid-A-disaccharide synthase
LPFEVDFFEKKHHYPIHYVGNPTAQEVKEYLASPPSPPQVGRGEGCASESPLYLEGDGRRLIALLAGSRQQEIKDNLPAMIEATSHLSEAYDIVLAGAPGIDPAYYQQFLTNTTVRLVSNETYPLLAKATAALVTSGTATLETCMFRVPQVVCYETPLPRLIGFMKRHVLKVKWVSLVNLIANREVVRELVAETFSVENIRRELEAVLPGGAQRERMLNDYEEVHRLLGDSHAPDEAARIMIEKLNTNNKQ